MYWTSTKVERCQVNFNTQLVTRRTPWHRSTGCFRDACPQPPGKFRCTPAQQQRVQIGLDISGEVANTFIVRCLTRFFHNRPLGNKCRSLFLHTQSAGYEPYRQSITKFLYFCSNFFQSDFFNNRSLLSARLRKKILKHTARYLKCINFSRSNLKTLECNN